MSRSLLIRSFPVADLFRGAENLRHAMAAAIPIERPIAALQPPPFAGWSRDPVFDFQNCLIRLRAHRLMVGGQPGAVRLMNNNIEEISTDLTQRRRREAQMLKQRSGKIGIVLPVEVVHIRQERRQHGSISRSGFLISVPFVGMVAPTLLPFQEVAHVVEAQFRRFAGFPNIDADNRRGVQARREGFHRPREHLIDRAFIQESVAFPYEKFVFLAAEPLALKGEGRNQHGPPLLGRATYRRWEPAIKWAANSLSRADLVASPTSLGASFCRLHNRGDDENGRQKQHDCRQHPFDDGQQRDSHRCSPRAARPARWRQAPTGTRDEAAILCFRFNAAAR